jgi:hypothetical protein
MLAKVVANLTKNGFAARLAHNAAEAKSLVLDLIPAGLPVGVGGSVTIRQMDLIETLRQRGHEVFDHWEAGLSLEQSKEVKLRQVGAPVFLASANAVTQDGKLVNIDNTGNRVAAMIFGPNQVIVVAGRNKIVDGLDEALLRIKMHVAPLNAKRRMDKTPCAKTGECQDCHSPDRTCRVTTILERKTRGVGTFSVIIVDEDMGY